MFSKRKKTVIAVLLLVSLLGSVLSGCGGQAGNGENAGNSSGMQADGAGDVEAQKTDAAMGRYMESAADLSELSQINRGIYEMPDGSLRVVSHYFGVFASRDQGETWEPSSDGGWQQELMAEQAYIMSTDLAPDGTVGVIYNPERAEETTEGEEAAEEDEAVEGEETTEEDEVAEGEETTEEDETVEGEETSADDEASGEEPPWESSMHPVCAVYKPDGTVIHPEISVFVEEDFYISGIWMKDDGRIFVTTLGKNVYEVFEDGSAQKAFTAEVRPDLVSFVGERLIYDGSDGDGLYIYNLATGQHEEDPVLNDFVNEYYADRDFNGGSWYDLFFFAGKEENVLYLAGDQGLHRHVMDGGSVEEVINGSLSSLNNPANGIVDMIELENHEFMVLYSSQKIVRFTYDPNVPSVPDEKLKVYSLEENSTLRQAAALYQTANPETFVEYEIGMGTDGSVTREDALKKLNTEIVSGEGPDLMVLDGMPLDSYLEKGLLLDVSDVLAEIESEEGLFENITGAFEENGAVCAVPCEFQLPVIGAKEKYASQMKDLKGIADAIEQIRKDHPGEDLLNICTEEGIMRLFSMVCAPSWQKENGELDTEAIGEFLLQTRRIYEAQMEGLPEEIVTQYNENSERLMMEYGMELDGYDNVRSAQDMNYVGGLAQLMMGTLSYPYLYAELTSVQKTEGFEEDKLIPMNGQSSQVFLPQTIAGISVSSENTQQAKEFLRLMLGEENQSNLFSGFAVNQKAFDESFVIDHDEVDEEGIYGGIAVSNDSGLFIELAIYWPDDDEISTLKDWIKEADTPYLYDSVLEEAICKEGANYMQGKQSLEETVQCIEERVAIYMAE